MRARLAAGNGFMSRRAGVAVSRAVTMVAVLAVHAAPSALALTPGQPMPAIQADAAAAAQGRGFRHRHRAHAAAAGRLRHPPPAKSAAQQPPVVPPPALPPPVAPPAMPPPSQTPTPQPQGRLVKVTVKIGSQAKDPQKGWLGVQMDALELPLALSLGLPNANGVLILEAAANSPAGQAGLRFGDIAVGLNGRPVATGERAAPARVVDDAGHGCGAGGVARHGGRRRFPADAAPAGARAATPTSCFAWAGCMPPAVGVARDDDRGGQLVPQGRGRRQPATPCRLSRVALLEGRGAGKDPQEGVRLLRAAADKDNLDAMYRLGVAAGRRQGRRPRIPPRRCACSRRRPRPVTCRRWWTSP